MFTSRCNSMLARLAILFAIVLSMELHAAAPSEQKEIILSQKETIARLVALSDDIIGLEAIVADATKDAVYSRFGHAMLRFVKSDGDFATDIVVSLMADVDMQELKVTKATFGGYSILPLLSPLSTFWDAYVRTENRPLSRYIIVSTPSSRKKLIATLKSWIENPKLAGSYSFFSNNCVGALAGLLEAAGFPKTSVLDPRIPVHFDDWLKKSLLSPFPALRAESPKASIEKAARILNLKLQQLYDGTDWPSDAAQALNSQLNDLEIKQLLMQLPEMPSSVRSALVRNHRYGNGGATLEEVMGFTTVPSQLYRLCDTSSCMKNTLSLISRYWSDAEWQDAYRKNDFAFWLASGRPDPDNSSTIPASTSLSRYPQTAEYFRLLLKQ